MLDWEYDDELAKKVQRQEAYEEAYEEAYAEAYKEATEMYKKATKETTEKNTLEMIKGLLKEKFPIAGISRVTGWSEDKILQVAKDI